jgi:hypothetical protein
MTLPLVKEGSMQSSIEGVSEGGEMNERERWKEREKTGTYRLLRGSMDASRVLTSMP